MLFDDRLATVLRAPTGGDRAARTQYRQLLDLLGNAPGELTPERYALLAAQADNLPPSEQARIFEAPALAGSNPALLTFLGWQRLEQLGARISPEDREHILREPGQRLRNPQLVGFLANGDARTASAAVAAAQLSQAQWHDLIPRLPVMARGFLRHRRDLPASTRELLSRLGVGDMVLPRPDGIMEATDEAPAIAPEVQDHTGIRALLQRIEAFREGRRPPPMGAPRLPLGDLVEDNRGHPLASFDFASDAADRIVWAQGDIAPLVVGMRLGRASPGTLATLPDPASDAMRQHQLLHGAHLVIDAAPAISGEWRIDAEPVFQQPGGQFTGYRGRVRRPLLSTNLSEAPTADTPQDRMRQVLLELRTPVNAIQGFAEVIQQQIFGPAPNAYRALAAGIAVDAAKLLAALEEVDRLSRLESHALDLAEGDADLREAVSETIQRLDGVLRPREAGIDLVVSGSPFTTALAREELLGLVWRVLATLAGAMAPAERIEARLVGDGDRITLACRLPAAIAAQPDPFASTPAERQPTLSAGMFGSGFSLRLARAEVQSAGGTFEICDLHLSLTLPLLTSGGAAHSNSGLDGHAA